MAFACTAQYPLVMKFSGGAGAANVKLVKTRDELELLIRAAFSGGLYSLHGAPPSNWALMKHRAKNAMTYFAKGTMSDPAVRADLNRDYVLLQEFLAGNEFDTRVTVIGKRAFAFRRFNRPDDFRASGSGRLDYSMDAIDMATVRLALRVARTLQCQSVAIDGLRRAEDRVVGEISYAYMSSAVHACPGHWELAGEPDDGQLTWVEGQMWPEEAQMQDFLQMIGQKGVTETASLRL